MVEGRGRYDWAQTAQVLAMLYNANRGERSPILEPADFSPFERARAKEPDLRLDARQSMETLKAVFGRRDPATGRTIPGG